ncbi:hypothetical protein NEDG_01893 [Nematocida displodere]|uniref:GATA-type domain-containing protein n=1 Tax=Nematocida displodere TaxID=1805483 RepID=A0A177EJF3_9MICR|nr:hypothetical protein NEDG_01893 [Nematocida displodere]
MDQKPWVIGLIGRERKSQMEDKQKINDKQSIIRKKIEMRYATGTEKENRDKTPSQRIKEALVMYQAEQAQSKKDRRKQHLQKTCGFCSTAETSLWRRIGEMTVCNACGLYYRIHGKIRTSEDRLRKRPKAGQKK